MKSVCNWLNKNNFSYKLVNVSGPCGVGSAPGVMVDNDYIGAYPGKIQFDNLEKIRKHFSKNYNVAARGFYTGILITKK